MAVAFLQEFKDKHNMSVGQPGSRTALLRLVVGVRPISTTFGMTLFAAMATG
jgi:hypothetical protein